MKFFKTLLSSLAIASALFSTAVFSETKASEPQKMEQLSQTVEKGVSVSNKLNINTATASEIQKALIGIGAKKAEAIVQYREKYGNFTTAEQLLEVQGIGKATLEKNRERFVF